jgi:inosine-uridine nucleoside N-ribohydrolase
MAFWQNTSMRSTLRTLTACVCICLWGTKAFAQKHSAQPVIIDTDIGDDIDDAFALAYALNTPGFHILGITTTFGDTELRAHIVTHLLDDAHRTGIPVMAGTPTPPKATDTQANYGHADKHPDAPQTAVDFILQQARRSPGQITLITIGPLMNIGAAIDRDPTAFRQLKRVVVMGGSIARSYKKPDGSSTTTPSPEWNILNDPASARKLLNSGVPVYLLPLDYTQILFTTELQTQILGQPDKLLQALAELAREAHRRIILYDPATVAFADNPSFCPTQPMHIEIDDKGYTRQSPGEPNANVCLKSDEAAFLKLFTERLTISARSSQRSEGQPH